MSTAGSEVGGCRLQLAWGEPSVTEMTWVGREELTIQGKG